MNEEEFKDLLRYQTLLSRKVLQEAKTDRKIKILEIIASFPIKRKIQVAEIMHEAELHGLLADDVYMIVDELVRDGMLVRAGENHVIRT